MLILVTGGAACGKSSFAEELLMKMQGRHYYVATMHNDNSDETKEKIRRHRSLRSDKGFITIEKEHDISEIEIEQGSAVLVECMSNLLANEMFIFDRIDCAEHICSQIEKLNRKCHNLIIITNEVSSDGILYDDLTEQYIENMGKINTYLSDVADKVIEVVYSIPVVIKGENDENF